jgi:predicted dehydrogenase
MSSSGLVREIRTKPDEDIGLHLWIAGGTPASPESTAMQRREFLRYAAAVGGASCLAGRGHSAATAKANWTAAVIGHTGQGNYGHGLQWIFEGRSEIDVVGLADPDAAGRAKAQERVRARRTYADYREMLEKERPQLVSVAPRWTNQHHAMVKAALAVGAHVYCEKPFTQTLAEADELLAIAAKKGRKIAVAHQGRVAPATFALKRMLDDGALGELLEIRVHGKQDKRAGGEDMVVLGTHQFDLVRHFAGDALWCSARVLEKGRVVTLADARPATENIGPVVGDEIEAFFALPRGVSVRYTSRGRNAAAAGPWGMELIGTQGRARLLNDVYTTVFVERGSDLTAQGGRRELVPIDANPNETPSGVAAQLSGNRRVVDDWLEAIARDREPACSGVAAMKSLEMIHAVFAAGISRQRVEFPLRNRQHPLAG